MGYDWYHGKSHNAVSAEENNKFNKSHFDKNKLIEVYKEYIKDNDLDDLIDFDKFTKKYLLELAIEVDDDGEWHHTGRYYKETNYYGYEPLIEWLFENEEYEQPKKEKRKKEQETPEKEKSAKELRREIKKEFETHFLRLRFLDWQKNEWGGWKTTTYYENFFVKECPRKIYSEQLKKNKLVHSNSCTILVNTPYLKENKSSCYISHIKLKKIGFIFTNYDECLLDKAVVIGETFLIMRLSDKRRYIKNKNKAFVLKKDYEHLFKYLKSFAELN